MSNLIDAEGNINANYLSKELQQALEEDVRYKQTDSMKKRAIKISTDYNEFKAMVACAHLKTLTSKEVESLSHVKKGWQKSAPKDKTTSAVVLTKELEKQQKAAGSSPDTNTVFNAVGKPKPKLAMEVQRDLRRISDPANKLIYLFRMGLKRAKSVLGTGADTDLLEEIILLLVHNKDSLICANKSQTVMVPDAEEDIAAALAAAMREENNETIIPQEQAENPKLESGASTADLNLLSKTAIEPTTRSARTDDELLMDLNLRVKWLKAIAEFDKFDLTKRFLSKDLLEYVVEVISAQKGVDNTDIVLKYAAT